MRRLLAIPFGHHKLAEFTGQVNERNSNYLWFPLQAHGRAQRIVDEIPRHLHHLLELSLIALQTLGVLNQEPIRMLDLPKTTPLDCELLVNTSTTIVPANRI